jgi:hypothetical protein
MTLDSVIISELFGLCSIDTWQGMTESKFWSHFKHIYTDNSKTFSAQDRGVIVCRMCTGGRHLSRQTWSLGSQKKITQRKIDCETLHRAKHQSNNGWDEIMISNPGINIIKFHPMWWWGTIYNIVSFCCHGVCEHKKQVNICLTQN